MIESASFAELVAEGAAEPVAGWDFSWFAGRATEERPPWGYARLLGQRMAGVESALDIQTGGGEVLAGIPHAPARLAATESWPPNIAVATRNLAPLGATVVEVDDTADLPFPDESFELVVSRHPTTVRWSEVARVLRPGGTYFSQHVGPGSVYDLTAFMIGPYEIDDGRSSAEARQEAEEAGLTVVDLQDARLRMEFHDIGAVVYFLRKVPWIVPGFTVDGYRDRLRELHAQIGSSGPFVTYSTRFLIEARRPA